MNVWAKFNLLVVLQEKSVAFILLGPGMSSTIVGISVWTKVMERLTDQHV